jgi:hypothetical protein
MSNLKEGSSCGSVVGFSVPEELKQRKEHIDNMHLNHKDINPLITLKFFSDIKDDDEQKKFIITSLDGGKYDDVADRVREYALKEVIDGKIREVVRKKKGGGGYVLYAPNAQRGKKTSKGVSRGQPKAVGTFPTKLGAKKAEYARFRPKDPKKAENMRKSIEKMQGRSSNESVENCEFIRPLIEAVVMEAMFRGDKTKSDWSDFVDGVPEAMLFKDKSMQRLQKNIDKKSNDALNDALAAISKAVRKTAKIKQHAIKYDEANKRQQMVFNVEINGQKVGPISIYIENGTPNIELTAQAREELSRIDSDKGKLFRAELISVKENTLDNIDDVTKAIEARDKILDKLHAKVEAIISELSDLEKLMFKRLISSKYRGK